MAKVFTITEGLENMGAIRTGGQGSVYKGKRMGAIISAVKLLPTPIHTENTEDKNFRDFQNEVEKLKKVNEHPSPNVVKILNSGLTESGSFPFIEMEYIEGPDLEELLKPPHSAIFSITETIKLAGQLANALAHCHKVNVKHGDIKSNNVKFNVATDNYILLDFGLAVMSDEQRRSSLRHAGAVEFMAPEQHEGQMLFQSDVYSYGIILYELLAGTVPFPLINKAETSRNMVMLSHIEKPLPDLMELRKNNLPASWTEEKKEREMQVPSWLLQIIAKCLEKRPENRFADGIELYNAFIYSNESFFSSGETAGLIEKLQNENEQLTADVAKYKRTGRFKTFLLPAFLLIGCLAFFGINTIFNKKDAVVKDSTVVTSQKIPSAKDTVSTKNSVDTLKKAPTETNKNTNPKKVKKTKDGLINDVPEF